MSSSSNRPDLHQLRIRAKELKRGAQAEEPSALDRIFASHPKFAGRSSERMDGWKFSLRDAQVTIARELGFESWKALLVEVDGQSERWNSALSVDLTRRAYNEAIDLKQSFVTTEHFLLALMKPAQPTTAAEVLTELGLTYDEVLVRARSMDRKRPTTRGAGSTQAYQLILGWAQGIAIGQGATRFTDEHALLALAYGDMGGESLLVAFDLDPDEVVARLRNRGVRVPGPLPPVAPTPIGPLGVFVYFPKDEFRSVSEALVRQYPPGSARWGTNSSKWKKGFSYVHGEDDIPMEEIVRKAVKDKRSVEVLSNEEGIELEKDSAPGRSRRSQG